MDVRLTWTDCGETGDYVVPNVTNVFSPRDLHVVSRPNNMDETVLHTHSQLTHVSYVLIVNVA